MYCNIMNKCRTLKFIYFRIFIYPTKENKNLVDPAFAIMFSWKYRHKQICLLETLFIREQQQNIAQRNVQEYIL